MIAAPAARNQVRTRCQRMTAPGPTRRKKSKISAPRGSLSLDNGGPHKGSAQTRPVGHRIRARPLLMWPLYFLPPEVLSGPSPIPLLALVAAESALGLVAVDTDSVLPDTRHYSAA